MQVNDKEEALAHQRKVSYMLARAMEMKEDDVLEDRGNSASGRRPHEARGPLGPVHACCCDPHPQNTAAVVPSAKTPGNPAKTLRKSHSWPPETTHREENNPCGKSDETVVLSV